MGANPTFSFENNSFLSYFKIEETIKNLNQVGFEPGTFRIRVSCITTELPRSVKRFVSLNLHFFIFCLPRESNLRPFAR